MIHKSSVRKQSVITSIVPIFLKTAFRQKQGIISVKPKKFLCKKHYYQRFITIFLTLTYFFILLFKNIAKIKKISYCENVLSVEYRIYR